MENHFSSEQTVRVKVSYEESIITIDPDFVFVKEVHEHEVCPCTFFA